MIEKAIEDERRKSMLDEQKIRQLEKQLQIKVEEAGRNYENYIAAQEEYRLSEEQIQRLRMEMERERRTTMAENEYVARRLKDIERENK